MIVYTESYVSPVGIWTVQADELSITAIRFDKKVEKQASQPNKLTTLAIKQIAEYFANKRQTFDLPLATTSYSAFYRGVWKQVSNITYGKVKSYSDIAVALDNPKAVRAVGLANGKNPFPLVIPCHRVLGKDRSLTGYALGLEVKRWLLVFEGAIADAPTLF